MPVEDEQLEPVTDQTEESDTPWLCSKCGYRLKTFPFIHCLFCYVQAESRPQRKTAPASTNNTGTR